MSKYTTQLRWPIEQYLNTRGFNHKESNWKYCYNFIGLDDYPLFDDTYRETLNNKIIRAYYFREIGFETMGQFAWQMRRTMHEIMPYYNQLYDSERLALDPLYSKNMDYSEKWSRDETRGTDQTTNTDSTSKSNSASRSSDKNVFQDTPMNGLDTGAIESMDYATNVTLDNGSTTNEATGSNSAQTDSSRKEVGDYDGTKTHNERGYDKSQSELLLIYRKTFLNIDLEIVNKLNILFMGLW